MAVQSTMSKGRTNEVAKIQTEDEEQCNELLLGYAALKKDDRSARG